MMPGVGPVLPKPSLWQRVVNVVSYKADDAMTKVEDPRRLLEQSSERMRQDRAALNEPMKTLGGTVRKLESEIDQGERRIAQHDNDIATALTQASTGPEASQTEAMELARSFMKAKKTDQDLLQRSGLALDQAKSDEQEIVKFARELDQQLNQFKVEENLLIAQHQAVEAMHSIRSSAVGVGDGQQGAAYAVQRVRQEITDKRAEMGAMESMVREGVLTDVLAGDPVRAQLHRLATAPDAIDADLAAFARERGIGATADSSAPAATEDVTEAVVEQARATMGAGA